MIVFLTLCYCGLLAALLKLGVIKFTLWWKISPLVWMLLLFVVLFVPMQWGAPAGPVNVYQSVVEIIPNVAGEVIEVPVMGLVPLKEGDVLFRIDPAPFQHTVDQLRATLADAEQGVLQLQADADAAQAAVKKTESDVDLLKANEVAAQSAVEAGKAALREVIGQKEKAIASLSDLQVQAVAAQREYDRIKVLSERDAASQSALDTAKIKITGLKTRLESAEVDVRVADDTIAKSQAELKSSEANATYAGLQLKQLIETELPRVRAQAKSAVLAANSMIGDVHTNVATAQALLENAEYDLEQTVVRAPSDGFVVGVSLRPGQRVANLPLRSWMSFVPTESTRIGAGIPQFAMRHVKAGQKAEVTLKLHPGRVFSATVDELAVISAQGQLQPSGVVMAAPGTDQGAVPFGVRLKLDPDQEIEVASLPGGAFGSAAIYTDRMSGTHIIRRVMLRMEAWINYVKSN